MTTIETTEHFKGRRVHYTKQKQYRVFVQDAKTGRITKGTNTRWNSKKGVIGRLAELENIYYPEGGTGISNFLANVVYQPRMNLEGKATSKGAFIAEVFIDCSYPLRRMDDAFLVQNSIRNLIVGNKNLEGLCDDICCNFCESDAMSGLFQVEIHTNKEDVNADVTETIKVEVSLTVRGQHRSVDSLQTVELIKDYVKEQIKEGLGNA